MRFRVWLPVLQTVAMTLILWSPWSRTAHELDVVADGNEIKTWMLIPGPASLDWAQAINLPAATVVTPAEFVLRNGGAWRNSKVFFFGLWIAGILCWYMVGRVVDDLVQWGRSRILPSKHASDLMFAFLALPASIMMAVAFPLGGTGAPITSASGPIWISVTSIALILRVAQAIKFRRRRRT
jgi:hypothetical protein